MVSEMDRTHETEEEKSTTSAQIGITTLPFHFYLVQQPDLPDRSQDSAQEYKASWPAVAYLTPYPPNAEMNLLFACITSIVFQKQFTQWICKNAGLHLT